MPMQQPLRFRFSIDPQRINEPASMSVTYVGRVNRKSAAADAQRRFEEWRSLPPGLAKRWAQDQVVVS